MKGLLRAFLICLVLGVLGVGRVDLCIGGGVVRAEIRARDLWRKWGLVLNVWADIWLGARGICLVLVDLGVYD